MSGIVFPCQLPLGEDLLRHYNFFELYPLDGGGCFITRELFGTLDDEEITRRVLETTVMDEFGGIEALDFPRYERWRSIEKSCWINRCYFLAPMARQAWLKGDADIARKVLQVMLHFSRMCPPPVDLESHWKRVTRRMQEDYNSKSAAEIAKDETDVEYIWYDMQPAQRLLIFLYASFFIWDFEIISDAERTELLACLKQHVRVLADQEFFQKPYCDNHQSLRGVVTYFALPLLAAEPDYEKVEAMARNLCSWHVMHEFLSSGTLFEYSPSYQAFVLWHARDFWLLTQQRGVQLPAEVQARIEAAATAQAFFRRPDNLTLTINDSYQFDSTALMASLGSGAVAPAQGVLNPGGMAVARVGEMFVAVDASGFIGKFSHYHGGKNSAVAAYKGVFFLEEAGCPSYDAKEFADCKMSAWHSSMLVDGHGDTHQFGLYGFDGWAELTYDATWKQSQNGTSFSATETSNVPQWKGVTWKRTTSLNDKSVWFDDEVQADGEHAYTLLFNLAPDVAITPTVNPSRWVLTCQGLTATLDIASPVPFETRVETIGNCQQKVCRKAHQLQIRFAKAAGLKACVKLEF